ncbi:hypothetical protein PF004_g4538 [Phytophthora fragariae]|uniref:Uncharacterized protein n=2 Tax=Phytophthora fragariae TaxID=53985 RepID=A0A6G0PIA4_9STRA|nr:hypothetical protein PF004_g4538 [Phytophthora fragariae]
MLVQRLTGDPDARILAATTFRDLLEVIYAKFCGLATELLLRVFEAGHGFPFLNLHHDGWTTGNGKVSVMGASASFIDASWQPREIALLLTVGHSSHMSSDVQKMICTRIEEVFGVDINTMAQFTVSDTASREQGDSRDLRPGDEHPQATQQRCKRLEDVQKFFCLPSMGTTLDCDMRVAYTVKLFQQTIVNYSAFAFYSQKPEKGDDASVFEFLSAAEWRLVTEMEAIVCSIADLARIEVQRSGLVASELIVLLKFTANRLIGDMFSLCDFDACRNTTTTVKSFPRHAVPVDELSPLAHTCLARMKGQVEQRIAATTAETVMILLLDPRTKFSVNSLIQPSIRGSDEEGKDGGAAEDDEADDTTERIVAAGNKLLVDAHREVFCP